MRMNCCHNMIASTICYFCLLSVSWLSVVRAALTSEQKSEIRDFWVNAGHNLALAYDALPKSTLNAYISEWIADFRDTLDPYLGNLDSAVLEGEIQVAEPVPENLSQALNELPGFVYLIRYSNLWTINRHKVDVRNINRSIILININDEYVSDVSVQYGIKRTELVTRSFEAYILDAGILFSMNKAMLDLIPEQHDIRGSLEQYQNIRRSLEQYQDMVSQLHHEMARYMQIQTAFRYLETFENFENHLNELPSVVDRKERTRRTREVAEGLFNEIVHMVVIYGSPARPPIPLGRWNHLTDAIPAKPGTEIISWLLENRWEVRYQIGLGVLKSHKLRWTQQLLRAFELDLQVIVFDSGAWRRWIMKIQPMLRTALGLLKARRA
jgi:hypothetical protein